MTTLGYIVQQHSERLSRPVKAYDRWAARIPRVYRKSVLTDKSTPPLMPDDPLWRCLKHYRSLVPMAQEARKPISNLQRQMVLSAVIPTVCKRLVKISTIWPRAFLIVCAGNGG